jgi:hypothetical protein
LCLWLMIPGLCKSLSKVHALAILIVSLGRHFC